MISLFYRIISLFYGNIGTTKECLDKGLVFDSNVHGDEINYLNCRSIWKNSRGIVFFCDEFYETEDGSFVHPTLGKMWPIILPDSGRVRILDKTKGHNATKRCLRLLEPIYVLGGEYYLGPIEQGRRISTVRKTPLRPYIDVITYEGIINLQ